MKRPFYPQLASIAVGSLMFLISCQPLDPQQFKQSIAIEAETIDIDNAKDTMVNGRQGTVIFIEGESFQMPDGSAPKGTVKIVLKECYSTADMIRENLTTTSNGRLLETGGMVNVTAFADGKELQLKEGKKLVVHFPKAIVEEGAKNMNLFYGDWSDTGGVNWKLDSSTLLRTKAGIAFTLASSSIYLDPTIYQDRYIKDSTDDQVLLHFTRHFDQSKLRPVKEPQIIYFEFSVAKGGNITVLKVKNLLAGPDVFEVANKDNCDPYLLEFMRSLPPLKPYYKKSQELPDMPFHVYNAVGFSIAPVPVDHQNNEHYNQQFQAKYSRFKDSTITTINEAELHYYILSSSKLGWINCDYFWNTPAPLVNFAVKIDPATKPDVKLIFKEAKSIMKGELENGQIVFKNIPQGQDVKIVAISFQGNKPMLAISETKTSNQIFNNLAFKEFSLAQLEKALAGQ